MTTIRCERCLEPLEANRAEARMTTCRRCGDTLARRAIAEKSNQVGPAFNKGGYVYLGGADVRQNLLDAGKKTTPQLPDVVVGVAPRQKRVTPVKRDKVGVYWTASGDCFSWYVGDDPDTLGAVRKARLDGK